MVASTRFPRLAIAATILAVVGVLLVIELETVSSPANSALDLAMVLLAATCAFYVAQLSSAHARQLWTLLEANPRSS